MIYDIAIIGAGAAGMTAALYALRANKTVLLLESTTYGGQILQSPLVENYPALPNISGADFSNNLYAQLKALNQKITYQTVLDLSRQNNIYQLTTKNQIYQAKTVILATGTISRKLNLPNESDLVGKGIAFCATCDGSLYKNQDVAVVGGGSSAALSALYLSDLCKNVFLIHRSTHFRAEELLLQKLETRQNIHIIADNEIKVLLEQDGLLSGINLKNPLQQFYHFKNQEKSADTDSDIISKLDPIDSAAYSCYDKANNTLYVKALFIEIGRIFPSTSLLQNLINTHNLKTDEAGFVITNHRCETNLPGFYAAGDCCSKEIRQLVTATSDGAISATSALDFLS